MVTHLLGCIVIGIGRVVLLDFHSSIGAVGVEGFGSDQFNKSTGEVLKF